MKSLNVDHLKFDFIMELLQGLVAFFHFKTVVEVIWAIY